MQDNLCLTPNQDLKASVALQLMNCDFELKNGNKIECESEDFYSCIYRMSNFDWNIIRSERD